MFHVAASRFGPPPPRLHGSKLQSLFSFLFFYSFVVGCVGNTLVTFKDFTYRLVKKNLKSVFVETQPDVGKSRPETCQIPRQPNSNRVSGFKHFCVSFLRIKNDTDVEWIWTDQVKVYDVTSCSVIKSDVLRHEY